MSSDAPATPASFRAEVENLLALYAWAIDDREYNALRTVFDARATADYQAFTCAGVEEIIDQMTTIHAHFSTTQHLIGSVATTAGPTDETVLVRSHVHVTLTRTRDAGGGRVDVGASYRDVIAPGSDGWRIQARSTQGRWVHGNHELLPWLGAQTTASTKAR